MDSTEDRLGTYAIAGLSVALIYGMAEAVQGMYVGGFWRTVGDDKVCDECSPLEGVWMTAEEFLKTYEDIHPGCRCSADFEWALAPEGEMAYSVKTKNLKKEAVAN